MHTEIRKMQMQLLRVLLAAAVLPSRAAVPKTAQDAMGAVSANCLAYV